MKPNHGKNRAAGRWAMAAAFAALTVQAPPVLAQDSTGGYLNAQDTMSCICWEDEMVLVDTELNGPEISAVRDEFNRVDELLRQAHANLDTNDKAEVESVQRISDHRTQLKEQLDAAEFPLLRKKVAITTEYNKICSGKKMLLMNVDAARNNPQCPALPQ